MVASDGLRGTLRQPANPSEGWRTATGRKNRRNQVDIERKILNLVEQAFREANCARNRVLEVAPLDQVHEVTNRSQTTGNFNQEKLVSENEPRKKRWRRMRSSWRPLSSFPNREERKLLNKNINTMSKWDFECALAEFKRNEQKLEDITGQLEHTLASHYHSAAACVYTNHATRYKLLSTREYYRWWKGYLTKTPMEAETHANAAHSLRKAKLTRMDKMCDDEFNFNGDGYGVARATEPDTFGIRFKQCNLPRRAKRGKCRNPSHNPDFGWKDEEWSREYYDAGSTPLQLANNIF